MKCILPVIAHVWDTEISVRSLYIHFFCGCLKFMLEKRAKWITTSWVLHSKLRTLGFYLTKAVYHGINIVNDVRIVLDRFSCGDDRRKPTFREYNGQRQFECHEGVPMSSGWYCGGSPHICPRLDGDGSQRCSHGCNFSQPSTQAVSE